MLVLVCYVPVTHLEKVKEALFSVGCGKSGNYEKCCFQVAGKGQFLPTVGANPFLGTVDNLEIVDEIRVETTLDKKDMERAIQALKEAHPYEVPAYHFYEAIA
ncbi:MAG: NGG1p interacting factor NIF3 [Sphaerochaetaceae bacterium]